MVELLAVVAIIGVLVGLLLPAVQSARESARRTSCSSNLIQVAIATSAYHDAFKQLPVQLSGTDGSSKPGDDNNRRLSAFVALLPFMDAANLWDQIQEPLARQTEYEAGFDAWIGMDDYQNFESDLLDENGKKINDGTESPWPAGGPDPSDAYAPWYTEPKELRCPSDPGVGRPSMGRSNYAFCIGDGIDCSESGPMKDVGGVFVIDDNLAKRTKVAMRGLFVPRVVTRFSDATDGLSHTIMLGEMATDLGDSYISTHPVVAMVSKVPDAKILMNDPGWVRMSDYVDLDRPRFWTNAAIVSTVSGIPSARRGHRWADGMPLYTSFNTILPPNRELVLQADSDVSGGVFPASSRHQGGAHVAFGDGAIHFITDSIDAGNDHEPTVYLGNDVGPDRESPYGVWGAMGTAASQELAANQWPASSDQ
ncbi:hypothetical protein Poly59_58560 [Rubripirellula reticaptiva]|uniref:DUF1559 domain-containing protein n=2 Tax=Rubripirellula reticaptiva TaxID=2528013 RepID=A0A5C6ECY3_9BACT|nr:hypothetical protein Poly59_58560 [Rubripirellula reticaptiva]